MVWFVHNLFDVLPGCLFLLTILGQHWDWGSWVACEQNSAGGISAQLSPGNDEWLWDILTAHQFGPGGRKTLLLLGRGFGSTAGDCWCGRAWGGEHWRRGRQSGFWRRTNKLSAVLVPVKRLVQCSLLNDNGRIYFLWPWYLRQRPSATMSSVVLFVLFVALLFARAAHHDWIDISDQRMWVQHYCGNMNIKGLLLFFKEFNFPLCQRTLLTELHVLFLFERHFFDWISFSLWAGFTILGERNQHLKYEKITNVRKTTKLE